MPSPLVSVIVPCFNRARYVREAIDSALAQTYAPLEVIAVDDGSTDETPAILDSYGRRIRFLSQANAGVAAARNTGIAAAGGEYIALLDSDDAWLPEKIACQIEVARRWPEAALIHTVCRTMDEHSRPLPAREQLPAGAVCLEPDALERLLDYCYPNTSSSLLRRSALERSGAFDADFEQNGGWAAEDWELYLRLAERDPFASAGAVLTCYRVHTQSKTADRLPHTLGLIRLRQTIEARKASWLAVRDTPGLRRALARHTQAFAHVYGRLGLIYQARGEWVAARDAFREAMRLEPRVFKHRVRYARMALAARRGHGPKASHPN